MKSFPLLFAVLLAAAAAAQTPDSLDFLAGHTDFRNARGMLREYLHQRAFAQLEGRREAVGKISGAAEVAARKRYLRERMTRALGGFPERTPLNARTTGVVERDGYRIEKVIFESQPKFYVTANLYVPTTGRPPYPAVLYPLGHEGGAKAHVAWQQMLGSLAKKGYIGLAWDTLGQGERIQLFDPDTGESKMQRSTSEHTNLGWQCLLVGDNLARYTIWDGIRALDYLLSRKEVDAERVACSGNSGGGTHTAYLTALDDRIRVAAPSCYLTSWRRLLETIGPQDAEQCLPPWLADGLDHADFVYAAAPRPYLMLSAIRDFFSITGARETFRESQRIYDLLGAGDKLAMVEADDGHGFSKPRRLAAYDWFSRWFRNTPDRQPEPEVVIAPEEELYCTPTGQVATSLGGETVSSLNLARARALTRGPVSAGTVARAIGFAKPAGAPPVRPLGAIDRPRYTIEKLVYESEPGIAVPAVVFAPKAAGRKPAVLFANGRGKSAARAELEELAEAGIVVLALDARGLGETRGGDEGARSGGDYDSAMTALLTGSSLVGMRVLDIVRGLDLLAGRADVDAARISAVGREQTAVPLLHAAMLDARLGKIVLDGMPASYMRMVEQRIHRGMFEQVVRGVLQSYDLPELAAALAPRAVLIADAVSPMGQPLPLAEVRKEFARAANVRLVRRGPADTPGAAYREFLSK